MFKNYCVVIMGHTDGSEKDILGIADSNLSSFTAGGLCIYTFTSAVNATELSEWLKSHERNFLFFELSEKTSGFNIRIPEIHEKLFGFLNDQNLTEMDDMFNKSIEDIEYIELPKKELDESIEGIVASMSDIEKTNMLNELLEKEVLNEKDKIILQYLVK